MTNLTGQDIGRYRIIEPLGQGGMAMVYRGFDTRLECDVAVKFIRMEQLPPVEVEKALKRFEREAKEVARLTHPNIVKVTDYGEYNGTPYLVMPYLSGGSLKELAGKPMPYEQAARLLAPVGRALEYAHEKNLIHRDIKPGNILLTDRGQPLVADFGIAKILDVESGHTLTSTNVAIGTPEYMAPEQWFNQVSAQSDIYSLGVVFYELVTGRRPYTADTPAAIFLKQSNDPLPRPRSFVDGLPEEVEKVLYKALAKKPEERYASMGDFASALEGLVTATKPAQSQPELGELATEVLRPGEYPAAAAAPTPVAPAPRQASQAEIPVSLAPVIRPERTGRGGSKLLLFGLLTLLVIGVVIGLAVAAIRYLPPAGVAASVTQTRPASAAAEAASAVPSLVPSVVAAVSAAPTTPANQLAITTRAVEPAGAGKLKVGLVTDVGGVNDKSFNQSAWASVRRAAADFNLDVKFVESRQPADYEKNIDALAAQNYDVIVTVGFLMGDATAVKARQYPRIKFAIIDNQYFPTKDSPACPDTVKDCYADGGLSNVTSLMFQEDQAGFLAGVLAGGMTKTGTVCSVSGMEIPPVVRYVTGFQSGARWIRPGVKTLNVYIPSFTDPGTGASEGVRMIGQGCDVVFAVGGNTGNGALLAARQANRMAIGVDVDQYNTYPEVQSALISSAMKNVEVTVYNYLKSVADKSVRAGVITGTIQNGGVGLAPFHDWDSKIPAEVKAKIQAATEGLKNGTIRTGMAP